MCGRTSFRLSRIRRFDLNELAMLKLPVRCQVCRHRGHTSLMSAFEIARDSKQTPKPHKSRKVKGNALPSNFCKCGQANLRLARIRKFDLSHLFQFQYPVRCQVCRDRAYTSIWNAFALAKHTRTRRMRRVPSTARSAERYI